MAETALFLDRDGTIVEDVGYLSHTDQLAIYEAALEAVQLVREVGMRVVVVTNQSGLARGLIEENCLHDIHEVLREAFLHQGAPLDAIYYCPHHPQGTVARFRRHCNCRKPEPGLLRRAAEALEIDLGRSYMVGDKLADIVAGHRAGCTSVLVQTGSGEESLRLLENPDGLASQLPRALRQPDHVALDVLAAARWILEDRRAVG